MKEMHKRKKSLVHPGLVLRGHAEGAQWVHHEDAAEYLLPPEEHDRFLPAVPCECREWKCEWICVFVKSRVYVSWKEGKTGISRERPCRRQAQHGIKADVQSPNLFVYCCSWMDVLMKEWKNEGKWKCLRLTQHHFRVFVDVLSLSLSLYIYIYIYIYFFLSFFLSFSFLFSLFLPSFFFFSISMCTTTHSTRERKVRHAMSFYFN